MQAMYFALAGPPQVHDAPAPGDEGIREDLPMAAAPVALRAQDRAGPRAGERLERREPGLERRRFERVRERAQRRVAPRAIARALDRAARLAAPAERVAEERVRDAGALELRRESLARMLRETA